MSVSAWLPEQSPQMAGVLSCTEKQIRLWWDRSWQTQLGPLFAAVTVLPSCPIILLCLIVHSLSKWNLKIVFHGTLDLHFWPQCYLKFWWHKNVCAFCCWYALHYNGISHKLCNESGNQFFLPYTYWILVPVPPPWASLGAKIPYHNIA